MNPKVIARIACAVVRAAEITGVSEEYLWKLSRQESGLNPHARPPTNRKTADRAPGGGDTDEPPPVTSFRHPRTTRA